MLDEKENTYLAKWLNNDLSPEELEELKKLPEYDDYKKIVEGLTYFKAPSFDLQPSLATTLGKIYRPKKAKVINLKPIVYTFTAAASIVLIIGLFFNTVSYTADPGQQLAVVLPDGSSVDLNAASTLTHRRFFWSQNRKITLEGEAYFKVISGSNFTVATKLGKIEVLGTQFNVKSRATEFSVACYEGKVRVSTQDNQQKILQKGNGVSLKDKKLIDETITDQEPLWKKGESIFNSVPLIHVLDELERQYDITFRRDKINQNQLFTGGFNYNDLSIALESVLVPMGIEYVVNGTTVLLSVP
ncbi:ferric-dicitrate binding protein FerR (iron transport regulator) [Aquimarina sp. EL_43]|uniref:FecR family protein n=1 Tax=unclassified Aquimarina TaxID=2627091 RepID=UPI0018CBF00D|nr:MULTISPECIES: FecR family protein [unclassified Aquimarina]MBG6131566.1 ferric-dicitrate binding protein FerR (iron transport regulator) [Aquimarina sp. EL_35]MBG6152026.1 ferric-dicitrate binding protein FerR (iron transport regulator) [Aquimarina sp. EL_32]MBG6170030.1 ferric-dicitrate binding protein FerR (iron transport regulator) [Aquimarina sp. EL_43]